MSRRTPRSRFAGAAILTTLVLITGVALVATPVLGQAPAPISPPGSGPGSGPGSPTAGPGTYVGVATCASALCHGSTVARDAYPVLQNEYYIWLQQDRHAHAYEVLLGERSRIIARNLRLGAPEAARRCLDCHALAPPKGKIAGRLEIEDGVTCESCHGAAGGWLEGHRAEGWSHEDSVAAGMIDLRGATGRAGLCLGCHLGGAGRTVDHQLIAAGHPALVFELDNYTADMPPHWNPGTRDARGSDTRSSDTGARGWALGQVLAFRAGVEQLARRARSGPWPEFAEMRCDSCHHSLDEERWRRAGTGTPGLPRWSPARWAALRPLVAAAAPGRLDELDRAVAALASGVTDLSTAREEVARRAETTARELAEVEPRLKALRWDEPRVRSLLVAITSTSEDHGYDAAVQLFLAANTLTSELFRWRPELATQSGLVASLDGLDSALERRSAFDPERFDTLRARLESQLRRLP